MPAIWRGILTRTRASTDPALAFAPQTNAGWIDCMKSVRYFDPSKNELVKVAEMAVKRWYPTATLLPNRKVLIMGGTQGVGAG